MIEIFHVRCYYGRDPIYTFTAWTKGILVVLSVSVLVLKTQGVPLGLLIGDTLRLNSDEEGWHVKNLAYVEGS